MLPVEAEVKTEAPALDELDSAEVEEAFVPWLLALLDPIADPIADPTPEVEETVSCEVLALDEDTMGK